MGKMLLLFVVGAGLIYAMISLNISQSNTSVVVNSIYEVSKSQAKNNATSGIEFAIRNLKDDTTWTGFNNKTLENGSVTVIVQNTSSKYYNGPNTALVKGRLITAIGTYNEYSDTIRAVVQLPGEGTTQVIPEFLEYAVASGESVELQGSVEITDDNNNEWNANVHTNGSFQMQGNNTINGFVTYNGSIDGKKLDQIVPNNNPYNLDPYFHADDITIPTFYPDSFKTLANTIYEGDVTISGITTLGTIDNPKIIYVGGDLTIKGNFTGYGAFIVQGDVTTSGNITFTTPDGEENNMGIFANGDIHLKGHDIRAQIFSNHDVEIGANTQLYGGVTSKGSVHFQGSVNLFYKPISNDITDLFWIVSGDDLVIPKIVSYYEK